MKENEVDRLLRVKLEKEKRIEKSQRGSNQTEIP
jgi:hypothetical protein